VYTSNARYSDKPNEYVLTAYKAMMRDFYTRKICQKLRLPDRANHCYVQQPIGSCTISKRHSIVSNEAARADGRRAISNAVSNPVSNPVSNAKAAPIAKRKRADVAAAELHSYRFEHPGDGGSFVPTATIQAVLTKPHCLDSSAHGSLQVSMQCTIREAFDSKKFAMYVGTTKQRLGCMKDFLRLSNKAGHDEWLR
jgi:hypothetical protein